MNPRDGMQLQLVEDEATVEEPPAASGKIDGGPPPLMTAQEVAELLRVPRSTVYELARKPPSGFEPLTPSLRVKCSTS